MAVDAKGNVFKDARGARLEVGDICVKGSSGDSVTLAVVEIVGFKNKVKIAKRDGLRGDYDQNIRKQFALGLTPSPTWCDAASLIKVDALPFVMGRRNTHHVMSLPSGDDWTPAGSWTPDFGGDGR